MENRAGYFRSNLSGDMAYQSFVPAPLPPTPPVDLGNEGLNLLIQANRQLALLEGLAARIPNMDLFVSMYVRKEALLSSQIEGTQATLDDVLNPLMDKNANRNVADVINYIKASEFAIKRLQELPLCSRLIKETHAVLMENVRGQEKNPGEFRYSQNWIGGQGNTLKNARCIPPNPEDMKEAISDLEKYMNAEDSLDPLVRAALIHYQFETIHPFLDGNGRVGRLLITLFLMAVMESAEDAVHTIDQLTALHDKNIIRLMEGVAKRQSDTLKKLFAYLEANPIIEVKKTSQALDMAYNTIARAVSVLVEKGILVQSEKAGKTRIYSYSEYLEILRKDT